MLKFILHIVIVLIIFLIIISTDIYSNDIARYCIYGLLVVSVINIYCFISKEKSIYEIPTISGNGDEPKKEYYDISYKELMEMNLKNARDQHYNLTIELENHNWSEDERKEKLKERDEMETLMQMYINKLEAMKPKKKNLLSKFKSIFKKEKEPKLDPSLLYGEFEPCMLYGNF